MRILFVQYTAQWTGPSRSLVLLARGLRSDHEPIVVLPGKGPLTEALTGEGIECVSLSAITKWQLRTLTGLVRGEAIDVVYSNNTSSVARVGFAAAKLGRAGYVCHVRGMAWDRSWLELGYLRRADQVIAVSRACADSVRRFVRRGRLHVVYNGVSLDELGRTAPDDRPYLHRQLGLPDDARVVMVLAHLCERKGQVHAVRALSRLRPAHDPVHLCLVGSLTRDAAYVDRVRTLARDLGIESRVHLTGFRDDAARLLRGADAVLHTALVDPHPRAVVEAMAVERPVVAFDVDGVSETVLDGETGRLVASGDDEALAAALDWVLDSPERASDLGRAGRRRVEASFTEDRTAEGVRAVLARFGDEPGRAGANSTLEARVP